MTPMSIFSGQIILVGTAVCEGFNHKVAKGARCAMLCVCDCDRMEAQGRLAFYETEDGLDAGKLLDETLGQYGWGDIRIKACLPVSDKPEGWEPELEALIGAARRLGVAHMVFEPQSERPTLVH
ncbi:hypothetical protein PbB2_02400 [Candidatus Phycosocius bacilliformis]|uniref:Uncharacterized protein n=2 Tax=Candidatus Phycosocius bacilliformis TaxID=1445552 RepID=A0A2P2ECC5_9PROT|nr:hypothetical protein PbB2_02400 [Candidatus Phycosocius bacilliformis]